MKNEDISSSEILSQMFSQGILKTKIKPTLKEINIQVGDKVMSIVIKIYII